MSIIEQATKRLEELRRAGIEVPPIGPNASTADVGAPPRRSFEPRAEGFGSVVSLKGHDGVALGTAAGHGGDVASEASRSSRYADLNLVGLAEQGYLTPSVSRGPLAEDMRIIKMQIIRGLTAECAREGRANLIVVTSAVPGEGKTFFSMNLAMSVAMEIDLHALLVDADVLRPSIGRRYGIPTGLGLLDLLTQPTLTVADVMIRTNVPKLAFIPAGNADQKSAELLGGNAADRLLADLADRFPDRLVIVDAPPLLATTEARHLAARAGHVIIVVEADKTDSRVVSQAFDAVTDCPMVSSVLNRCPGMPPGGAYGYYGT